MNENMKLILAFFIGLVVGILAATSTLFQDEPELPATQVTSSTPGDAARMDSGAQTGANAPASTAPQAQALQPAAQTEPAATASEAPVEDSASDLAQNEPDETDSEDAVADMSDVADEEATDTQEAEERFFCMLLESSGQCRCFDVETNEPVDISVEECRTQLAEE